MRRWYYRRMAWKNDPRLFCEMHPRLTKILSKLRNNWSWPIRDWWDTLIRAAETASKIAAIEDVYGYEHNRWDMKYWKYDGRNGDDVYASAREMGWQR